MNTKNFYLALALIFLIVISCEKEILTIENSLNDKTLTLVEDEVFADISFVELLDEGDDGIFWGDEGFLNLKSGDDKSRCATKEITNKDNNKTLASTKLSYYNSLNENSSE